MQLRLSLLLLVLLSACSSSPTKPTPLPNKHKPKVQKQIPPAWTKRPKDSLDAFYATGSSAKGKDKQSAYEHAKNAAYAMLTVKLIAQLSPRQTKFTTALQTQTAKLMQNDIAPAFLSAIKISQTYTDKHVIYALAKAERKQISSLLKEQIKLREKELMPYLHKPLAHSTLAEIRQLLPAQSLLLKRNILIKQWQSVRKKKYQQAAKNPFTKLQKRINKAFNRLQFALILQQENSLKIQQQLVDEFARLGIQSSSSLQQADLLIALNTQSTSVQRAGSFYTFLMSTVTIDNHARQPITRFEQQVKGVSATAQVATDKAVKALVNDIIQRLAKQLVQQQRQL